MAMCGKRWVRVLAAVSLLPALAGCLGGGQVESLLRVRPLGQCEQAPTPEPDARTVILEGVTSLPGLQRTAVLFERNQVLRPSGLWRYEAEPETLVSKALARGLLCSDEFELVWPYSPRARSGLFLTGQVNAFEVRQGERNRFRVEVELTQWEASSRRAVGARSFTAEEELQRLSPEEIAAASERALGRIVTETLGWLRVGGPSATGE